MRRRLQKSKRWKRKAKTLGICTGLLALTVAPWAWDKFGGRLPIRVRDLQIFSGETLPAAKIQASAGLEEGSPLFGKTFSRTLERLKANPRVSSVVARRTVTGDVVILVNERKAAALVNFDELYYIDETGLLLGKAKADMPDSVDLPVLTGPWSGKKPSVASTSFFQEGIQMARVLAGEGFSEKMISELHYDVKLGWVLYRVGWKAALVFGRNDYGRKARRLKRVLKDFEGREGSLREVDLDFRDRAIVKLKGRTS